MRLLDTAEDLFWASASLFALMVAYVFAKLFLNPPRRRR